MTFGMAEKKQSFVQKNRIAVAGQSFEESRSCLAENIRFSRDNNARGAMSWDVKRQRYKNY